MRIKDNVIFQLFEKFIELHTNKIQLFTLFKIVWNIFKVNIGDEVGVRFWISWMVLFTESFLSFFLWQNVVGIHSNCQTFHVPWNKICLFIRFIKKIVCDCSVRRKTIVYICNIKRKKCLLSTIIEIIRLS